MSPSPMCYSYPNFFHCPALAPLPPGLAPSLSCSRIEGTWQRRRGRNMAGDRWHVAGARRQEGSKKQEVNRIAQEGEREY